MLLANPIAPEEVRILNAATRSFYDAVPLQFERHCALNSTVLAGVMRRLGVACGLVPCQLWYAGPAYNHIVGFVGSHATDGIWDGHVVCASDSWFIDAAVHHMERDAGIKVPRIIAGRRFNVRSNAIARHDLSPAERLWWLNPPPGADTTPPQEPPDLVEQLTDAVHVEAKKRLQLAEAQQ